MLVISKNGTRRVVSGWRAWLAFGLMCVVSAIIMTGLAFFLFGLTVTVALIIVIGVPVALVGALIAQGIQSVRGRS